MNMDYFRKVDHLLNDGISQSRVVKIISKQRGQSEEIEKKISRNNFVGIVYKIVTKGFNYSIFNNRVTGSNKVSEPRISKEDLLLAI